MRGALGGPRVLLRRLRETMAEPVSAQERLDKIVVLIAANMVAEVCSVYVLRVDGTLELYATEGLKREAVHQTVLRLEEGLVGLVASEANPVNLSDAQNHPAFAFRPETGEEIYHSFLGVPILRTLEIVSSASGKVQVEDACTEIARHVSQGGQVSEIMATNAFFPPMMKHMVKAGESSGTLVQVLRRMAQHFQQFAEVQAKFKSAMIYPVMVIMVGILLVALLVLLGCVQSFLSLPQHCLVFRT